MNIFLSFDYEIFFGKNKSDSFKTLIEPTNKLLNILNSYNLKTTFFVDAGYLLTLEKYKHINKVQRELEATIQQIYEMEAWGHEIGFHVHSHWEDTCWKDNKWNFDLRRYKLSDFNKIEAQHIFLKYYTHLNHIITSEIRSFRAGGWCLEPFDYIRQPMIDCGILIDSTVFKGGKRLSKTHRFDFTAYPIKDTWKFSEDPGIENENGEFKEMSISSMKLDSYSYCKLVGKKMIKKMSTKNNGKGISPPFNEITSNLFRNSNMPISMDSVKSEFVMTEFKRREKNGENYLSLISHPKSMDQLSLKLLVDFIQYALKNGHSFSTVAETH